MLIIQGDHFILFAQGLVLALFILFCFFELFADVALAVTVHHRAVLIDTIFCDDLLLIDLVVSAQS